MLAPPYSFAKGSMHSANSAMPAALGCRASGINSGESYTAVGTSFIVWHAEHSMLCWDFTVYVLGTGNSTIQ